MRKRKPPIFLATIGLILAAIVFGLNYQSGKDPKAAPPQDDKPEISVSNPRPTNSVAQTASQVASQIDTPLTPAKPAGPKMGPMGDKGPSTIANVKFNSVKPTPNDSAVYSGWYDSNSRN